MLSACEINNFYGSMTNCVGKKLRVEQLKQKGNENQFSIFNFQQKTTF
jgi:hypothetical protein